MNPETKVVNVPEYQVYPAHWIHLPHEVREHLAKIFDVRRSGPTEIVDNKIISDGRMPADLKSITKEKMQEYLLKSKEEDFMRLWELTLSKARGELHPPQLIATPTHKPVEKPVDSVDIQKKEVNGFRPQTAKEKEVMAILDKPKNANDKSTKKK